MKTLLLIIHAPSPNTMILSDAALHGARSIAADSDASLTILRKTPSEVTASDLAQIDGVLIGTLENIGAMAGLTKDMFDRCYNDWLGQYEALPVGIYIRAGLDGTATSRQLMAITAAQKWRLIQPPLILKGEYSPHFETQVSELAMVMATGLDMGLF